MDSEMSFDFCDLLHDYYDSSTIEAGYTVQQDLCPGDFDLIPSTDGPDAEPLVMDHGGDADIVGDCMAPLEWEYLDIDPNEIFAFPTDDCLEFKAEGICQPISAESQRLAAATTTVVKKHRRDAADDDVDAGGVRGAPRRATLAAEAEQLEPAPMHDDGSRQDREPVAAAAPLVSCRDKRDAATQVSEAEIGRAFGVTTRDVSTQAPEDEESSEDDASRRERSAADKGKEPDAAAPFGYSFAASDVTAAPVDDPSTSCSPELLPGDGSFVISYTTLPEEDFIGFLYDFYDHEQRC